MPIVRVISVVAGTRGPGDLSGNGVQYSIRKRLLYLREQYSFLEADVLDQELRKRTRGLQDSATSRRSRTAKVGVVLLQSLRHGVQAGLFHRRDEEELFRVEVRRELVFKSILDSNANPLGLASIQGLKQLATQEQCLMMIIGQATKPRIPLHDNLAVGRADLVGEARSHIDATLTNAKRAMAATFTTAPS